MPELLFLLLPIAVAYGWYMGKRNALQNQKQNSLSKKYATGLNFLLSNQSDKAVEHFVEMVKVDDETIETHLALATLFRKRGEIEKAIRVHKNIIERESITQEQYNAATLELARDFSSSGILDRAIEQYQKLVTTKPYVIEATEEIIFVYQQLKDWNNAIKYANKLPKPNKFSTNVAHYFCELASNNKANTTQKITFLKKALKSDPDCARANIFLGEIYFNKSNYDLAINHLQAILKQDIDFISETLPMLNKCYESKNQLLDFQKYLIKAIEQGAGAQTVITLAELLKQQNNLEDAENLELTQLQKQPSLKGFFNYVEYHLEQVIEPNAKKALLVIHDLVGKHLSSKAKYKCRHCGFTTNNLQWQCPSCKRWAQIKPVRGIDGE